MYMKNWKKSVLVWALILSMIPVPVFANDPEPAAAMSEDPETGEAETVGNVPLQDTDETDGEVQDIPENPDSAVIENPGTGTSGTENSGAENSGTESPETENPETENADTGLEDPKGKDNGTTGTSTEGTGADATEQTGETQDPVEVKEQEIEKTEDKSFLYDLNKLDQKGKLTVEIENADTAQGWIFSGHAVCPKVLKISVASEDGTKILDPKWYEVSYRNNSSIGAKAEIIIKGKSEKRDSKADGSSEGFSGTGTDTGTSTSTDTGTSTGTVAEIECTGQISRTFSIIMAKPVLDSSSSYSAITVSWHTVPGAVAYQIYRSSSPSSGFELIGTTKELKWQDTNTTFNASYYYKVVALQTVDGVAGSESNVIEVTKKVAPATIKSAQLSSMTSVKVKWKRVSGAQGYTIYYSKATDGVYKRAATVNGRFRTSYTVKKLKKGTRYYFKVRAFRKVKKKKCYSDYGEAKLMTISKSKRMKFLFPKGTPKKKSAMEKYLVTITVPIKDQYGNSSTLNIRVHRALAEDYKNAFQEMYNIGFPVRAADTDTYNWRRMASSKSRSHHSYGVVVDINWNSNPMTGVTDGVYAPGVDPYSVTSNVVAIWGKHGFYWGGNWRGKKDYMHFSYTNH